MTGKKVDKNLQTNINIINGEIFACAKENTWCDEVVFKIWFKNVFLKYEEKIHKKCLFKLDKSPSHIYEEILKEFKNHEAYYIFISSWYF